MRRVLIFLFFFLWSTSLEATNIVGDYLRAFFYLQKKDFENAYKELKKVERLDSSSSYLHLRLGLILFHLKKFPEAEKEFKKAKELDPDNLDISATLMLFYAATKEQKKLEEEYQYFLEKAHRAQPQNIRISEYLGQFYFYKKMPRQAIKIYKTIINQKPDYPEGYYWLGYLYEEIGERKKAIKMWKKTLKLDPNHADTLNSLGYIYAEEGIKLDEAEGLIKRALEKDPQNGAYLDSLGWVYFKKKKYKKAEEYLLKAAKIIEDPVIYEHLGDLYVVLKRWEEAVDFYKKGLGISSLRPSSQKRLKEKIEKNEEKIKGIKKKGK